MQKFVKIAVTEPEVSKVPFMLDASKFEIVVAGLKWCQGKPIVNSISLKVGEELFIEHATLLKKHGAAVVVMAFDENGQAAEETPDHGQEHVFGAVERRHQELRGAQTPPAAARSEKEQHGRARLFRSSEG